MANLGQEESKTTALKYAGFWIRVGAFVLDWIFVNLIALPLWVWYFLQYSEEYGGSNVVLGFIILLAISYPVIGLFYCVGYWAWCGQTPGKIIARIKIVRTDGQPISLGTAALRYLVGYSIHFILAYIPFIMVAFHKKKRGVHDLIADTRVIVTR